MGWFDANEYLLIDGVARDRLDDMRRAIDLGRRERPQVDPNPRACSASSVQTAPAQAQRAQAMERSGPTRLDRDGQLVEMLRRGAPTAAECLVATYGDRAYRLAHGITGSAEDAEEAVQDAFWTVIRKIGTFRGDSGFGSWLYRIVTNAACQKLRDRRNAWKHVSLDEAIGFVDDHGHANVDWSARVNDPALQTDLRIALTAGIQQLGADCRTVLLLRDVEGLSNHEIADALGVSVACVKSRVHRARLFLRKRLTAYMSATPVADCVA